MSTPLLVTAHLDTPSAGLVRWPVPLDGPLAWAAWQDSIARRIPFQRMTPSFVTDFNLPLDRWEQGGTWGWCASYAHLDVAFHESLAIRRKPETSVMARFAPGRRFHLALGPHKARDVTIQLDWVKTATWHVLTTSQAELERLLTLITHLGGEHNIGEGHVRTWTISDDPDRDAWKDRPLPTPGAEPRPYRPPYWHPSRVVATQC